MLGDAIARILAMATDWLPRATIDQMYEPAWIIGAGNF